MLVFGHCPWARKTMLVLAMVLSAFGKALAAESVYYVRTGQDLALAFAASTRGVSSAIVLQDIWAREEDWEGVLVNGTEPITLAMDFTLAGDPSLPSWPLLNMGFIKDKVRARRDSVTETGRNPVTDSWAQS